MSVFTCLMPAGLPPFGTRKQTCVAFPGAIRNELVVGIPGSRGTVVLDDDSYSNPPAPLRFLTQQRKKGPVPRVIKSLVLAPDEKTSPVVKTSTGAGDF